MAENTQSPQTVLRDLWKDPWVIAGIGLNIVIGLVYTVPLLDDSQMTFFSYYLTSLVWLVLVIAATAAGLSLVKGRSERRFWLSIWFAFLFHFAGEAIGATFFFALGGQHGQG